MTTMTVSHRRKIRKISKEDPVDALDCLPDDLVLSVLAKLAASASSPADFITAILTCKRLNRLGMNPAVLSEVGAKAVSVRAKNWSTPAHRFVFQCAAAGSSQARYTLGMIRFYCLGKRESGLSLMAKAAIKMDAGALYSLAVIQFNGSGGTAKNLEAGVALAQRAASLGHVQALRELGHCLQDGFGVPRNPTEGRRLLVQANARELASQYVHPANSFLRDWFASSSSSVVLEEGLRMCSHQGCGRPETRQHEFRRCSVCGKVNYCSRGCQALDWKLRHKLDCVPMVRWVNPENVVALAPAPAPAPAPGMELVQV